MAILSSSGRRRRCDTGLEGVGEEGFESSVVMLGGVLV